MKASDTVLSNGKLLEIFGTPDFTERQGREKQAEISFRAGEKKVVEVLKQLHLFVGSRPPIEDEAYVYLGDYILLYGENLEPQIGFYDLSDSPKWQEFLKSEEIK